MQNGLTERQKEDSWLLRGGGMGGLGVIDKDYRISFRGVENVLNLTVVMDAQLCEYIKNHRGVHFK